MGRDADRSHAGPAAAMWDAEGLVQVQVAHIRADVPPGWSGPTCAFILAPSMYTCPPASCTVAQMSRISGFKDAMVLG